VRATTMRGTIHMLTAADFRLVRPMLQPTFDRLLVVNRPTDGLDVPAVTAAGAALLDAAPMTAKDLGAALSPDWPGHAPDVLSMAVSTGEPLVQVPPRGLWGRSGPPAFTTARAWLGAPLGAGDPHEVVRRYLAAYGPASVRDLQSWIGATRLAPLVRAVRDELVVFRDEAGTELFDLPDAPRPDPDVPAPPRLLADFDTILLGHADRSRIITDEQRRWVFTVNGQIRGTFTVDGFVHGIWRRAQSSVTFQPFTRVPEPAREALTAEAERLLEVAAPRAAPSVVWE